jgi:hypothetical protein
MMQEKIKRNTGQQTAGENMPVLIRNFSVRLQIFYSPEGFRVTALSMKPPEVISY